MHVYVWETTSIFLHKNERADLKILQMAQSGIDFAVRKDQSTSLDDYQTWLGPNCCIILFVNVKLGPQDNVLCACGITFTCIWERMDVIG